MHQRRIGVRLVRVARSSDLNHWVTRPISKWCFFLFFFTNISLGVISFSYYVFCLFLRFCLFTFELFWHCGISWFFHFITHHSIKRTFIRHLYWAKYYSLVFRIYLNYDTWTVSVEIFIRLTPIFTFIKLKYILKKTRFISWQTSKKTNGLWKK